ncbi:hypothetical protein [Acinetobacter sp. Ac_5812]|uniref:hypothetical protein n=1 Tax=Acinetobacter sp. Ac_5812 TaxID=1848937 RepID=UPI00149000ED|nr:hypothetical protein [Acinetobacter sp. Ac_5812]NNP70416.1 hypothetical protein [Acinetobacter sp. Ac_5812]
MGKRQKLIVFIGTFFIFGSAFAEPNQQKVKTCEKILAAGMFNGLLEDVCGFEGNVKAHLLTLYDDSQCRRILPQKKVDKIAEDVLVDTKKRITAYSKHTFCEENMQPYVDLKKEFK